MTVTMRKMAGCALMAFEQDHKQVSAKVNAYVDEEIVFLIEELSRFPEVVTVESCQGDGDQKGSWICFVCGDGEDWEPLARFVFEEIGPSLAKAVGDRARISISVTSLGLILADLEIRPGETARVLRALRRIRRRHQRGRP